MADWEFGTAHALTRKAYAKRFWIESKEDSWFYGNKVVGQDETNAIIVEFPDLKKEPGDVVTYGQLRELGGSGVLNDGDMEGSEDVPTEFDDDITIKMIRNAVRLKGKLSGQRPSDNRLRMWAVLLLRRWMAKYVDEDFFDTLTSGCTKVLYGGDATATSDIESGDYFELALVSKAVAYAKKATPKIDGPRFKGMDTNGIVIMHTDQDFDLTERDGRWNQAQMEARLRGKSNPIFTGALGMHKMVPMHSHTRISVATTWGSGSNLNGASALFLGVGAGAIAVVKDRIFDEKTFDYANKTGFCTGKMYGLSKSVFNSLDNAVILIRTFRTNN